MATGQLDPRAEQSLARLELWFSCPNCGAPTSADQDSDSVDCAHCQSTLFLARPESPVIGMAECVLRGEEDLLRVYIDRRLAERRAELCSQPGGDDLNAQFAGAAGRAIGGALGGVRGGALAGAVVSGLLGGSGSSTEVATEPPFLKQLLEVERRRLQSAVQVRDRRLLRVPYWQVRALILQCIFGRERGGGKVVSVRARPAEQSTPAYDTAHWNMRDKGLRVGTARMKLLAPADVAQGGIFLPVAPSTQPARGDLERSGRLPPQDMERLHARTELVAAREFIVYRPIWLAQFLENAVETWMLIEGGTGIIGGIISEASERAKFLAERGTDPLAHHQPTRVSLAASRCVECGRDLPHEPGPWMRACPYCRTGLALTGSGLVRGTYDHARAAPSAKPAAAGSAEESVWVPCWSWRFALRTRAGEMIVTLEELAAALGVAPALRKVGGDRIHVPAIRLLGLPRGEKPFDDVCQWIHRAGLQLEAGAIPSMATEASVGCDLRESEARDLARAAFHALLDTPMIARLSGPVIRAKLDEPELLLADARLVFVLMPARLSRR